MKKVIEKLIYYATKKLFLSDLDAIYVRNALLNRYNIDSPFIGEIDKSHIDNLMLPDELIFELKEKLEELKIDEVDKEVAFIMGTLSPRPSEVERTFWEYYKQSKIKATDYLYNLSVNNYYIQKSKVDRNILWKFANGVNTSINLAKPEKSNKDIKKALESSVVTYPKCALCYENLGFYGKGKFEARENIRIIPLKLDDEDWFFQYSPYGYYDRHCIVIKKKHEPMHIDKSILSKLVAFVDLFPHFFIGSNSDLPITGGSILSHEHFQGGNADMPLFHADNRYVIKNDKDLFVSILDWYSSVVCLKSKNRETIINAANKVLSGWLAYQNEELSIIKESNGERHASITPILKKVDDEYRFYIVLRNNRTDEAHPDGIFHASKKYHHVKKEGIGLIESLGLFILPARLDRQLPLIERELNKGTSISKIIKDNPDLKDFEEMMLSIKDKKGNELKDSLKNYIGEVSMNILKDTAVFKNDEIANEAFIAFIKSLRL